MGDMAASSRTDLCEICEIRKRIKHAIKWCPECEEKLCDECNSHHAVSKPTRKHGVIDIEQYRKLPKSILGVRNYCSQHDMGFTNFCQLHDKVCCPTCISRSGSHGKCTTVVLEKMIKTAKTSALLQSVEETLSNLMQNLATIINDRQANLQNIHEQKEKILKEVKQMKEKIIKHLNDFEKNISDKLDKTIKSNNYTLQSEIANLQERLQQADTMLNESNALRQYGSDLQIFIGSKFMETEASKINNNLQCQVVNESMKCVGIKLKWDATIDQIIKRISSLGSILVEETPMAVVLLSEQGPQVQVIPSTQNMSIEDITIKPKFWFPKTVTGNNTILGCSFLPNNKAIFVDNENITLLKDNGEKENVIPVEHWPHDLAVIDANTVAVSSQEGVHLLNIRTKTLEKTIDLRTNMMEFLGYKTCSRECYGLDYYKGSLFCCVRGRGVLSIDLSSGDITKITRHMSEIGFYYCTVYNDRIYTTQSATDTVTCYTMDGDEVWEFKDPSVIHHPHGIAVDNSSNVYIASFNKRSIVVLSPDGQRHRTLLTSKNGIEYPRALYFDRSKNQLIVGNNKALCCYSIFKMNTKELFA